MGQKVNPIGLRVGVIRMWDSTWYARGTQYAQNLHEDIYLRKYLKAKLKTSGVSKITIERAGEKLKVIIHTSRPGLIIGKKGTGIDTLKEDLQKKVKRPVLVAVQEIRKPEMDAQLVAENIAVQLEKRAPWRRTLKKSITASMRSGVRGIKVMVSGRLAGAEIARTEWYTENSVPLHTLRADIDYGFTEAKTTYGMIGVKVWLYKGDILPVKEVEARENANS